MHPLAFERWSAGETRHHQLDARVKLLAALGLLLVIAWTDRSSAAAFGGYFLLLTSFLWAARVPLPGSLLRTLMVLPFVAGVVILNFWGGDPDRAILTMARSMFSAYTAIALLSTTPFPALMRGLERLRVPPFLIMVLHFVYRYLFLLTNQAQDMLRARRCRAPEPRRRSRFWSASAGAVAILFARGYDRAERIHHAMLARGFESHFPVMHARRTPSADWWWLAAVLVLTAAIHIAARSWPL
ncbi:MAG TPA: energy-coupling factor transporter transmembrane component T [Bryobacterales bacterium]|nr:energy-coupling factor transporter transmembrane component T [Bryobacterales bacterium]